MTLIVLLVRNHERALAVTTSVLLMACNLVNLYFIIDLLTYDEIVGYLSEGEIKRSDPHNFIYVLLITSLLNLLFVIAALCARLTKNH